MPNLDPLDIRLIEELQRDARLSNKELAAIVGIAASTCLERVRSLRARGVITGQHTEVALDALNRTLQAMVAVRLLPKTKDLIDRFVEHLWAQPETMAVYLLSGTDDVLIHLGVPSTERLRELVIDKIASFPGVVDERSSLVYEHRRKPVLSVLGG